MEVKEYDEEVRQEIKQEVDLKVDHPPIWNRYLIRYLVGTVLGLFITHFLFSELSYLIRPFFGKTALFRQLSSGNLFLYLLLGFAFCYIAGAPLLVFQATRPAFYKKRKIYSIWNYLPIFFATIIFFVLLLLLLFYKDLPFIHTRRRLSFLLFVLILLIEVGLVIFSLIKSKPIKYFEGLDRKRTSQNKEYIEVYNKMGEHGNAFMVVFFEIILGLILFHMRSIKEVMLVLIFWIIPAAFVWFVSLFLEFHLLNRRKR